jgi:acylphosphatase
MAVCKRVQYSGRVQGVGFRYTVQALAPAYPVAGWVRNLANGDVELVAEGPPEEVDAFLKAVAHRMADYIEGSEIAEQPASNLQGFRIRH